jgi:hypothetical protein
MKPISCKYTQLFGFTKIIFLSELQMATDKDFTEGFAKLSSVDFAAESRER